jgi:hypothetical protein
MDRFDMDEDDEVFSTNDLNSYLKSGLKKQQEIMASKSHTTPFEDDDEKSVVKNSLKSSKSSVSSSKRSSVQVCRNFILFNTS